MADQYVTREIVRPEGFLSRLFSSIIGVFFGFLLIIGAVVLLYWNDGRYDISNLARTAIPANAAQSNPTLEGKLVSLSGTLVTKDTVGDGLYLKPGNYLAVHRVVEMYAWNEHSETHSTKNGDGSETKTTTYTYEKDWDESPTSTADFKQPNGHSQPTMAVKGGDFRVRTAAIGAYSLDLTNLSVPGQAPLNLTAENTNLSSGATLADGQTVYVGQGNSGAPQLGDLRIRYEVVPSGATVTAFGAARGTTLARYVDGAGHALFGVYAGSADDAVRDMHGSYVTTTWIFRIVGFVVMWLGMHLLFGPILTLFGVIPIFGDVAGVLVWLVTFVAALTLTLITIIVSLILHSIIALALVVLLVVGVIAYRRHLSLNGIARFRPGRAI
ncbi:MAG TPA: TMEM43 family protein [Chloroflexota bacterium]|nr:TMEM43 family protein [Chloroflexota bacterium]